MLGVFMSVALAAAPPPAELTMRELVVQGIDSITKKRFARRVQMALPKGWTGDEDPNDPILRLFGPGGEGKMIVAVFFHPSQLNPVLTVLMRAHPSAAPSPPQAIELPSVRPEMGERATRFQITGQEIGEMVMVEKRGAIILFVTVVEPNAWQTLAPVLMKTYGSIRVNETKPSSSGTAGTTRPTVKPKRQRLRQSMTL